MKQTIRLTKGLWALVPRRGRVRLWMALGLMVLSSILELATLASFIPFLSLLTNTKSEATNTILRDIAYNLGIQEEQNVLVLAGVAFGCAYITSSLIRLKSLKTNCFISARITSEISKKTLRTLLQQPYAHQIQRNSSEVISTMCTKIELIQTAIESSLSMLSAFAVGVGILTGLLALNIKATSIAILVLGTTYLTLSTKTKHILEASGYAINRRDKKQIKMLQESIGYIKNMILEQSQEIYIKTYAKSDLQLRIIKSENIYTRAFPRYIFEGVAMCTIALSSILLYTSETKTGELVAILGALALGAQRLLPAMQSLFSNWAIIKSCKGSIEDVTNITSKYKENFEVKGDKPLKLSRTLIIEDMSFSYSTRSEAALKNVNIEIKAGDHVAVIGKSGSGKSTLVDVVMGLLPPQKGRISVDGIDIYSSQSPNTINTWRASISHVPQAIFLIDASIAQNIALGVTSGKIDMRRVEECAAQAQLTRWVLSTDNGFETIVGENGAQVSGGQRQRIGIARALYKNTDILVLDEATSALDAQTESAIKECIANIGKQKTVITITHRLAPSDIYDKIIEVRDGKCYDITRIS
jgi:ABC-type bacteriocin/lantibiotic exporter with double-glycine peptidase domain